MAVEVKRNPHKVRNSYSIKYQVVLLISRFGALPRSAPWPEWPLFATTSLMMPPKLLLFLSYSHALTIATLSRLVSLSPWSANFRESKRVQPQSCSPCTSTCSYYSNTQTSSLVARQSSNFLYDCMPLFERHHILHPCLSLWPSTSVLSFSISSLQCRHPPPQNSTL